MASITLPVNVNDRLLQAAKTPFRMYYQGRPVSYLEGVLHPVTEERVDIAGFSTPPGWQAYAGFFSRRGWFKSAECPLEMGTRFIVEDSDGVLSPVILLRPPVDGRQDFASDGAPYSSRVTRSALLYPDDPTVSSLRFRLLDDPTDPYQHRIFADRLEDLGDSSHSAFHRWLASMIPGPFRVEPGKPPWAAYRGCVWCEDQEFRRGLKSLPLLCHSEDLRMGGSLRSHIVPGLWVDYPSFEADLYHSWAAHPIARSREIRAS